jgi:DNA ligase (NAD+)
MLFLEKRIIKKCNQKVIKRLQSEGVQWEPMEKRVTNTWFTDKIFVITGTLKWDRLAVKHQIEEKGGKVSSSLSANTDYLICGENPGSKLAKAKTLGVNILTETDFEYTLGAI